MARNLNLCVFNGRLGRSPEIRYTASGKAVCSISMACAFDDKTEWINLVFWEKNAEVLGEYCTKGSFIGVVGRLQTRKWEDKDGNARYTTEIVVERMQMLDSKGERTEPAQQEPPNAPDDDSDVPF